jgi:hypothetical protein
MRKLTMFGILCLALGCDMPPQPSEEPKTAAAQRPQTHQGATAAPGAAAPIVIHRDNGGSSVDFYCWDDGKCEPVPGTDGVRPNEMTPPPVEGGGGPGTDVVGNTGN